MNIDSTLKTKLTAATGVSLIAGVCAILGLLPVVHVVAAALLVALLFGHDKANARYLKVLAWVAVFLVGMFMALYRPEGFSYFNSISVEQLHDNGKPYQQFVNLGKFFGALIIFSWLMMGRISADLLRALTRRNLAIAFTSALGVLALATLILSLPVIPKFSEITIVFMVINLLVTCFSEETFYRLIVQQPSERAFAAVRVQRVFGVVVAAAFFTLTHLSGDLKILAVMAVAGTFYAIVYALTRSVSASILTHFLVNAVHFIFLPYPI